MHHVCIVVSSVKYDVACKFVSVTLTNVPPRNMFEQLQVDINLF